MSIRTYVISDTHFGHINILTFKRSNGEPLRAFSSIEEMDETIVENWNKTVRPNGHKRLVRGNHDLFPTKEYMEYFEEIYGVRVLPKLGLILSHIPIHPESLSRWKYNVHGHLHANLVTIPEIDNIIDSRYINVSCERVNYTPVDLDEIESLLVYI